MDYPPNFINLIGQTFGELYVFEKAENDHKGCARFLARCSCGDERRYKSVELRKSERTACPKCAREAGKKATLEKREASAQKILEERFEKNKEKYNISGTKVKDWTVLKPVVNEKFGGSYTCQCKCGTLFNFNRSVILNEKIGRFCKKCLLEDNERARAKKREDALKRDFAICSQCNLELKIKDFDKTSLKKSIFVCCKCKKEYGDRMREKWFQENLLKDNFNCPKCHEVFERSSVHNSLLKARKPMCGQCSKIKLEERLSRYETENLKKEFIKCSKCKVDKILDQYSPSFLRSSAPKCSSCSIIYGREYDKQRFAIDPIYKEKYEIGRKIAKSLNKKGWKKGFTAIEYLGIDRDGVINHLESLFRGGMTWDNRSEWEIDHVIAASFAETSDEIKILWHYLNLQPLWCWENSKKSDILNWREQEWTEELLDIRERLNIDNKWKELGKNIPSRFFREPFCR